MTREIRFDLSRRPVQPAGGIWAYDNGGGIDISAGFTDITMDTEGYKNSDWFTFTATNAPITIVLAGVYEVAYYIGTEVTSGTNRDSSAARLMLDTGGGFAEMAGTRGPMYNRQAGEGYGQAAVSIIRSFSAGDIVKLQAGKLTGSDTVKTVADTCGITIKSFLPD